MQKYIDSVKKYIKENALKMLKSERGVFRHPFIDPGAGYEDNLWDWDSYWSAKSLFAYCEYFGSDADFDYRLQKEKVIRHAKGNVLNFFDLQAADGFIPAVTTESGLFSTYLRDRHLSGEKVNQHKPFLCASVLNASREANDFFWFDTAPLVKYLEFYDKNQFDKNSGLYFWRNDVMIGIDNNPTVFGIPEDSCADIYLNSFMYSELLAMAEILCSRGENDGYFRQKAERLKKNVRELLYDERDGLYYSAFIGVETHRTEIFHHGLGAFWKCVPIKIRFWGCFLPILCGIATAEEGRNILQKHYLNENMTCAYGVRTLSKDERMYNTEKSSNPSNWLGPVWIIANYCLWKSLKIAGMVAEAREMIEKTVTLLGKDISENGKMSESYVPETGEPMMYGGFLNWNVLVLEMIGDYENA